MRFRVYGFPVFGDELSTLWIVHNNGIPGTVKTVASDAELSPPLYFLLAWLATKFGSAPELIRLPALIAGTACIPLTWAVGRRILGDPAGVIAAALVSVSPFMTFYSANGRAYSLMMALLLASTLTMLAAAGTGRTRWWVAYGAFACLAMYCHYTAVFILLGQFIWLVFIYPAARKPALIANLAAAALFAPWITSALADFNSPTIYLLEYFQPKGIAGKAEGFRQLLTTAPLSTGTSAGWITILCTAGAVLVGGIVALAKYARKHRNLWPDRQRGGVSLILVLALAAPVSQTVFTLLGTDLLGARNLAAAWPGAALVTAMVFVAAGPVLAVALSAFAMVGLGAETLRIADPDRSAIRYDSAAALIDAESSGRDVIIDAGHFTPVPLTGLDAYLKTSRREFRLLLAQGEPPFLPFKSKVTEPQTDVDNAFAAAADGRVFVVTSEPPTPPGRIFDRFDEAKVPSGWEIESTKTFPGLQPQTITVFKRK